MRISTVLLPFVASKVVEQDSDGWARIKEKVDEDSFNFAILGDWGGWPAPLFQSVIQQNTAVSMMKIAKETKPKFVASLGDHFYFYGVHDTEDPMWQRTFEDVYVSEELQCPWYPTMGNHDFTTKRDGTHGNGMAQIEYSKLSDRWTYPDLFYSVEYETTDNTKLKIIFMDTPTMTGVYTGGPPTGTGPDDNWEPLDKEKTLEAVNWFEQELAASDEVDYLIVAGHYMILEALGWYDLALRDLLLDKMKEHKVTAWIQGHRHTLEHVQEEGFEDLSDMHFFTIGAGALLDVTATVSELTGKLPENWKCFEKEKENRSNGESVCHFGWFTKDYDGGFSMANVAKDALTIDLFSSERTEKIYSTRLMPRTRK